MTAEINKLQNEIATFINTVETRKNSIEEVMGKLQKNVRLVRDQVDIYTVSKRAPVPRDMLKNFPDVKQRLLSKLNRIMEEEIEEMTRHVNRISEFSEELRTISNKIEKLMTQIKWKEHIHFFIPFSGLFEWTDACWKYFQQICLNLRIGLTTVIIDDAHSCSQFRYVDTFDGINKDYVFSNPATSMFQMLKVDLHSRSKISVKSVKSSPVTR